MSCYKVISCPTELLLKKTIKEFKKDGWKKLITYENTAGFNTILKRKKDEVSKNRRKLFQIS